MVVDKMFDPDIDVLSVFLSFVDAHTVELTDKKGAVTRKTAGMESHEIF